MGPFGLPPKGDAACTSARRRSPKGTAARCPTSSTSFWPCRASAITRPGRCSVSPIGQRHPVVDTNVRRVVARVRHGVEDRAIALAEVAELLPVERPARRARQRRADGAGGDGVHGTRPAMRGVPGRGRVHVEAAGLAGAGKALPAAAELCRHRSAGARAVTGCVARVGRARAAASAGPGLARPGTAPAGAWESVSRRTGEAQSPDVFLLPDSTSAQ